MHAILQQVPWDEFERLCAAHGADQWARGFSSRSQLVALLYAQVAGAASLRDIEAGMSSHADRLHGLAVVPARRSTLAEALRQRPAGLFADLFAVMVAQAGRGLRRDLDGTALHLVDATTLPLDSRSLGWARFSAHACGAKLHVIYDAGAEAPIFAAVSASTLNDITAAQAMPVTPGATDVFDLGYYDYAWWARLDAAGCRIVTRLKANTLLRETQDQPLPTGSIVLSDRTGLLPTRQAGRRLNSTTIASSASVKVVLRGLGPIGASAVLARLRHFRTVLGFKPCWAARARDDACAAWSSARTRGVVRAEP